MRWLVAVLLSSIAASGAAPVRLIVKDGRPVVDGVFVDGHGPFRFLLDTGAESNQMDRWLAVQLGLRASFRVEMATSTGVVVQPGAGGFVVKLGSVSAPEQELLFTGLDGIREWSGGIQGVLGQAFLRNFDYLLDLRGKRLVFGAEAGAGTRLQFEEISGRPAVFTSLGRLVLDSGADGVVLFRNAHPGSVRVRSAAGFVEASPEVRSRTVWIEGKEYRVRGGVEVGRPSGIHEDGLLPASTFRTVYVSNSEKFVILDATLR